MATTSAAEVWSGVQGHEAAEDEDAGERQHGFREPGGDRSAPGGRHRTEHVGVGSA